MYYAGIGRRVIPDEIKISFEKFGRFAQDRGLVLRSGGAEGADSAFEKYVIPANKQIFLPWKHYNGHLSRLCNPSNKAYQIAKKFHPRWNEYSCGVQKLLARNVHQLLGPNLRSPVEFVVCWTEDGNETGGTGQGIKMAQTLDIPVFNFGAKSFDKQTLFKFVLDLTE